MPDEWRLVRDAREAWSQEPSAVRPNDPLSAAVGAILARPRGRNAYVVDDAGALVGVVSFRSLAKAAEARLAGPSGGLAFFGAFRELLAERARDLMRPAQAVTEETPLVEAMAMLRASGQSDLPIVDEDGRLVGELNGLQVLSLILQVLEQSERRVAEARRT